MQTISPSADTPSDNVGNIVATLCKTVELLHELISRERNPLILPHLKVALKPLLVLVEFLKKIH